MLARFGTWKQCRLGSLERKWGKTRRIKTILQNSPPATCSRFIGVHSRKLSELLPACRGKEFEPRINSDERGLEQVATARCAVRSSQRDDPTNKKDICVHLRPSAVKNIPFGSHP
jgi:hypothetical protein